MYLQISLSKVSIVIRTFNEEKWIRHCLISVFSQDFKDFDVIIVDNNSTDKTLEIQLPGGGVDKGEQSIHALHREVMEETGWHIRVLKKEGVFQRFTFMPEYNLWAHKICHIYRCKAIYKRSLIF